MDRQLAKRDNKLFKDRAIFFFLKSNSKAKVDAK